VKQDEDRRYRITIDTDRETYRKIGILIPHGLRNELFQELFRELIPVLELGGARVIAGIISRHIASKDLLPLLSEGEKK
jgi:hypothetical protein